MKRHKRANEYDDLFFNKLGINRSWYKQFVVPMVLKTKGNKCEKCLATDKLEVHHSSIDEININTLIVFCRSCHKKEHIRMKERGIDLFDELNKT